MKKLSLLFVGILLSLFISSCTSDDVKEISGTLVFNEIGSHSFNINAENIEATITMIGPNNGETIIYENVPLFRTVIYTAKIGVKNSSSSKTELLSNLAVMYEAESGVKIKKNIRSFIDSGYVKIDWKGID